MEECGESLWTDEEVSNPAIEKDVLAGDYYLLLDGEQVLAIFIMQDFDSYYWPEAKAGEALYLHRIVVRRAFAGAGHSQTILRFVVDRARQLGIPFIRLDCDRYRAGLNQLYTNLGFHFHSEVTIGDYHGNRYQLDVTSSEATG
mgnify:CR=1 FL=1